MKIIELEEVDSTNEYCKRINGEGESEVIVTAKRQTAGKGTKGRSFISSEGGLFVSVMRRYNNFDASETFKIMVNSCVAVCRTLEFFGLMPVIRWANDVLVNGRKICGTLIENTFSGGAVSRSIVGVGINVNNTLPEDLKEIATSMQTELKKQIPIMEVRDVFIENVQKNFTLNDYKSYMRWLGDEVTLKTENGVYNATAVDVDETGRLVCEVNGEIKKISAAEVSLRL